MSTEKLMGEFWAGDELARLREENELYRAMKDGVAVRIADLEAAVSRLKADNERLTAEREMFATSLDCGRHMHKEECASNDVPCKKHLQAANARLRSEAAAREATIAGMREALAWTLPFREFSDEWHNADNPSVVRFRELRAAALASDAGSSLLAERDALRKVFEAAKEMLDVLDNAADEWSTSELREAVAAADSLRKDG